MKNNRKTEFFIDDENIKDSVYEYLSDSKRTKKLFDFIRIKCDVSGKIKLEKYDEKHDDRNDYLKCYFLDNNNSIIILNIFSKNKEHKNLIEFFSDDLNSSYDLSLIKNYELSEENIEIIRTGKVVHFKNGRLITDMKSFYNLFLGNDLVYEVRCNNSNGNFCKAIIDKLNKLSEAPTFNDYLNIINETCCDDFKLEQFNVYDKFEKITSFDFEKPAKKATKILTIKDSD